MKSSIFLVIYHVLVAPCYAFHAEDLTGILWVYETEYLVLKLLVVV